MIVMIMRMMANGHVVNFHDDHEDDDHLRHLLLHHLQLKAFLALDLAVLAPSLHLGSSHETPPVEHYLEEGDG